MASNGKVALITGGGSGIGKASALALAREGFAIVVAGRRPEPLQAVVGEIEALQVKALGVPTDVSDPASVEALFAKTKATFGRLDVLFNNAGFGAAATERAAVVRVTDTGIGMSPEQIPIALAAFGQVDSRLARRYEGTGLGLPLSKAIIELHGGTITIDSTPGKGTCVTVTLPRRTADADAAAA